MKKFLISLVCIISAFIVFDNVKAATIPTDYGNVQFDFSSFKQIHSELADYNYYFITKRNNEQEPVLFFFKDIPKTQKLDYSLTFASSYNILYYNYNFNNNTWSLGSTNENLKFSFKNVFYDYNLSSIPIDNINYNVDILSSDTYYSLTLKPSPINVTYSYSTNGDYKFYYDVDTKQFINVSYNNSSINFLYNQTKEDFVAYVATPNVIVIEKNYNENFYLISSNSTFESFSSSTSSIVGFDGYSFNTGSGGSILSNYSPSLYLNQSNNHSLTKLVDNDLFFNTDTIYNSDGTTRQDIIVQLEELVPDTISKFNDNSYGFKTNNLVIFNANITSNSFSNMIRCVKDRDFTDSGYCPFYYSDFGEHSQEDILNSSFYVLFNTNYGGDNSPDLKLVNNNYYLFTYRMSSQYVPFARNLLLNFENDNSDYNLPIYKLYYKDFGSYYDFQLLFKAENIPTNKNLSSIIIFYNDLLKDNFSTIDTDFNFQVYNSYKLNIYDHLPTQNEIDDDYYNNSLNDIYNIGKNNSWFTSMNFNQHGLSSIITSPLRLINSFTSNNTCSPLEFTFPHTNQVISLPCMREYLSNKLGNLFSIFQLIISGLICYRVAVGYFNTIKNLQSPDNDKIEVVDL